MGYIRVVTHLLHNILLTSWDIQVDTKTCQKKNGCMLEAQVKELRPMVESPLVILVVNPAQAIPSIPLLGGSSQLVSS